MVSNSPLKREALLLPQRGLNIRGRLTTALGRQQASQIAQVAARVDVRVRTITTLTNKQMFAALGERLAPIARLTRIARVYEHGSDPCSGRLLKNLLLKLAEGPPMQTRTDALACLDSLANVREIFKNNQADASLPGFFNDFFADDVVDVLRVASFSARSFAQVLFGAARAVALKTASNG